MKKPSRTNWAEFDALTDDEIDCSDIPPLDDRYFREAVVWPGSKQQITLRLDPDVLAFFRKQGKGYQSTINAVLRKYVELRKRRAS
ncbi:MAG TPA: BrnA antitoxin family protein [Terriglobales bacterium]|jgi:uncharacterized protein (DUF4415 family)